MPYADPERQRQARRESARRQRAKGDAAGTPVEPVVTYAEIATAGRVMGLTRGDQETIVQYHERIRAQWRMLLAVVEGKSPPS